jgi:hypothetical protein
MSGKGKKGNEVLSRGREEKGGMEIGRKTKTWG